MRPHALEWGRSHPRGDNAHQDRNVSAEDKDVQAEKVQIDLQVTLLSNRAKSRQQNKLKKKPRRMFFL